MRRALRLGLRPASRAEHACVRVLSGGGVWVYVLTVRGIALCIYTVVRVWARVERARAGECGYA